MRVPKEQMDIPTLLKLRNLFQGDPQTSWGRNQLVSKLQELLDREALEQIEKWNHL